MTFLFQTSDLAACLGLFIFLFVFLFVMIMYYVLTGVRRMWKNVLKK